MTALAKDTPTTINVGTHADIPQAVEVIYDGSILSYNSAGYAGAFALGERFAGHAMEGKDNSAGSAGDVKIRAARGRYILKVTLSGVAITDAAIRASVYAQDSGTLSLSTGLRVGRVVEYLSANTALVEFNTEDDVQVLSESIAFGDFTDNANATGYVDLATTLPEGAIVQGAQVNVTTGFTGDTTAVMDVGIAGTLEKFISDLNVLAADVEGEALLVYLDAANTVRVTVTGAADFTSIAAGVAVVKMIYTDPLRV
jgi:hypothetical protein